MFLLGWMSYTTDADLSLFPFFHSEMGSPGGQNQGYYENKEVDELLEVARTEV